MEIQGDDRQGARSPGRSGSDGAAVAQAAIRWTAIVIIVLAILYFLARYIVPLLPRA
ncbi:MAG: hypothetical protein AB1609_07550 [Bacillota bacterium]